MIPDGQVWRTGGPNSTGNAARTTATVPVVLAVVAAALVWATWGGFRDRRTGAAAATVADGSNMDTVATAPAVTEPISRVIQLSSDRLGIIAAINAQSGQRVAKDQVLVQLDDTEAQALLVKARAGLAETEASLADLKAGTRPEEIDEAKADVDSATARQKFGHEDFDRLSNLRINSMDTVAVNEVERSRQYLDVAKADLVHAQAVLAKAQNGPTPTELAVAQARVTGAQASVAAAQTELELRSLRSPVTGVVLYVHMRPGDAVSIQTPQPIVSLAEAGPMHLRANVDEADMAKVFVGQQVVANSDAYARSFAGTVLAIEPIMGRPSNNLSLPRDRTNTRIREVVIGMQDDAAQLPIDLTMTARFLARTGEAIAAPATEPAK